MNNQARYIVLVNPLISPDYFSSELKKFNIKIIAVFTKRYLNDKIYASAINEKCFEKIVYDTEDNVNKIIATLAPYEIDIVLYGFEEDIHIADILAEKITPHFANPKESSTVRENKHETGMALGKSNLLSPKDCVIGLTLSNEAKKKINQLDFPVFIKPIIGSAGLRFVQKIDQKADLFSFLEETKRKIINESADQDLLFSVQEIIHANENFNDIQVSYSIDSFSLGAKNYIFSLQKWYKKIKDGKPEYYYAEQVNPSLPIFHDMIKTMESVLKVVELYNGYCHSEFFLTDKGPVLIDLNPRIAGGNGIVYQMINLSLGLNPVQLLVDALNGRFLNNFKKKFNATYLVSLGRCSPEFIETIKKLPTFAYMQSYNVFFQTTYVLLSHKNKALCDRDLKFLLTNSNN